MAMLDLDNRIREMENECCWPPFPPDPCEPPVQPSPDPVTIVQPIVPPAASQKLDAPDENNNMREQQSKNNNLEFLRLCWTGIDWLFGCGVVEHGVERCELTNGGLGYYTIGIGFLLGFGTLIVMSYVSQRPTINIVDTALPADFEVAVPDTAITIGLSNWTESRILPFVWPWFAIETQEDGFYNRQKEYTLLGAGNVRYGAYDCGLEAGYNAGNGGGTWPVFCVINTGEEDSLYLKGRKFGDPVWTSLHFGLSSCGVFTDKYEDKNLTDAGMSSIWRGECKSDSEIRGFIDRLRINVWFRFKSEDWQKAWEGGLPELVDAQGPARNPSGGDRWSYYIYEKLSTEYTKFCRIALQGNEFTVAKPPLGIDGWWSAKKRSAMTRPWLDMGHTDCYRWDNFSTTKHFDATISLTVKKRLVQLVYDDLLDVIASISGTWPASESFALGMIYLFGAAAVFNRRVRNIEDPEPAQNPPKDGGIISSEEAEQMRKDLSSLQEKLALLEPTPLVIRHQATAEI